MNRVRLFRALAAAAVLTTLTLTTYVATRRTGGDFFATLPGGYARTMNPILWESPDLKESWAFHKDTYLHGPSQYLTLYPIVLLDSYRAIAMVLLPFYLAVLGLTFWLVLKSVRMLTGGAGHLLPTLASMFLFIPVLQAYVQREFEVVALLLLAAALLLLVSDRKAAAAGVLAYLAWFKYLPLMFIGYLGLRRWWRATVVFVVVSMAVVGASHVLFGFQNFFNNNVPDTAGRILSFSQARFCDAWHPGNQTLANVRHGLCRVEGYAGVPLARNAYVALCLTIAGVYLVGHRRLSLVTLDWPTERWRRSLELSIVTTLYACFFFGHYYYLSALVVPLSVLLARYRWSGDHRGIRLWVVAYLLLSGSIAPAWTLARLVGLNGWQLYMQGAFYLYGEILLIALLLKEYVGLAGARSERSAETARTV